MKKNKLCNQRVILHGPFITNKKPCNDEIKSKIFYLLFPEGLLHNYKNQISIQELKTILPEGLLSSPPWNCQQIFYILENYLPKFYAIWAIDLQDYQIVNL